MCGTHAYVGCGCAQIPSSPSHTSKTVPSAGAEARGHIPGYAGACVACVCECICMCDFVCECVYVYVYVYVYVCV